MQHGLERMMLLLLLLLHQLPLLLKHLILLLLLLLKPRMKLHRPPRTFAPRRLNRTRKFLLQGGRGGGVGEDNEAAE